MPSIFACPSRFSTPDEPDQLRGDYRARYDVPRRRVDASSTNVTDGMSDTLMIVEVANVEYPLDGPDRPGRRHDEHEGE